MHEQEFDWSADPLIWGVGGRLLEVFLEPTCPFCARTFLKLDDLLDRSGYEELSIRIWLHSQPWHLFSGFICRAIVAASTSTSGREAAKQVMAAVFAGRDDFEFEDHRSGPNLDTSPNALIKRIEERSNVPLAEAFQIPGLERVVKQHTRYSRQNGIHESPTFMVNGLINPSMSSGQDVDEWLEKIFAA